MLPQSSPEEKIMLINVLILKKLGIKILTFTVTKSNILVYSSKRLMQVRESIVLIKLNNYKSIK